MKNSSDGHFTYKEDHNIIIDGEDDRHKNALECELACTVRKTNTHNIIPKLKEIQH